MRTKNMLQRQDDRHAMLVIAACCIVAMCVVGFVQSLADTRHADAVIGAPQPALEASAS